MALRLWVEVGRLTAKARQANYHSRHRKSAGKPGWGNLLPALHTLARYAEQVMHKVRQQVKFLISRRQSANGPAGSAVRCPRTQAPW